MEHDAVGTLQAVGEHFGRRRPTFGRAGREDQDASALGFRHEGITIRGDPDDARLFQARGEHLHREALGHIRHFALRRVDDLRLQIEIRSFGVVLMMRRRRQVCGPDVPADTGGVGLPGAEGIGAGEYLPSVHRREQNERQRKTYQDRRCAHKMPPKTSPARC